MYWKSFVHLCIRTSICTYTIFNAVYAVSDMNNINFKRFEEHLRELERAKINRLHKQFSTLMESVKKGKQVASRAILSFLLPSL